MGSKLDLGHEALVKEVRAKKTHVVDSRMNRKIEVYLEAHIFNLKRKTKDHTTVK